MHFVNKSWNVTGGLVKIVREKGFTTKVVSPPFALIYLGKLAVHSVAPLRSGDPLLPDYLVGDAPGLGCQL